MPQDMTCGDRVARHRQADRWEVRRYQHRRERGRECFFDGEECVFEIDLQGCCIRYGRLRPGGEALIGGHGRADGWRLFWGRSNFYLPARAEEFHIDALGPEQIHLSLTTSDEEEVRTRTFLRFGYSLPLGSYVYEFDQALQVPESKPWHGTASGLYLGVEYCNFWPSGSFNHSTAGPVETPDMELHQRGYYGRERWQWMIVEESPGRFCAVAINRLTRTVSENMRPCDGGLLLLAGEEAGNPTLQFLGDTGRRTLLGLCHAIFDVHVSLAEFGRIAPGRLLTAHYRLFDTPLEVARALRERAEVVRESVPWVERRFLLPKAFIPGINRFEEPVAPYEPSGSYFWRPVHGDYQASGDEAPRNAGIYRAHAIWDRTAHQLVLKSPWTNFLGWGLYGANFIPVTPGRRYCFRVLMDLEDVSGEGLVLGYSFYQDRLDDQGQATRPLDPVESQPLTGSGQGLELVLETKPAPDCIVQHGGVPFHYNLLDFWIVLKGKGCARISEVEISVLDLGA